MEQATKSQILGLLLGFSTAVGCIFFEKITHNFSFMGFIVIKFIELLLLAILATLIFPNEISSDYQKFFSDSRFALFIGGYILTGVTSILWYVITKKQGVMTGSIYEVKYIVMLAIIYILFGDNKFTLNTAIGILFAVGSIYFISKS